MSPADTTTGMADESGGSYFEFFRAETTMCFPVEHSSDELSGSGTASYCFTETETPTSSSSDGAVRDARELAGRTSPGALDFRGYLRESVFVCSVQAAPEDMPRDAGLKNRFSVIGNGPVSNSAARAVENYTQTLCRHTRKLYHNLIPKCFSDGLLTRAAHVVVDWCIYRRSTLDKPLSGGANNPITTSASDWEHEKRQGRTQSQTQLDFQK